MSQTPEQLAWSIKNNKRHGIKGTMKLTRAKWLRKHNRKVLPKMKAAGKNGNGHKLFTKDQTVHVDEWEEAFEKRMAEWRAEKEKEEQQQSVQIKDEGSVDKDSE